MSEALDRILPYALAFSEGIDRGIRTVWVRAQLAEIFRVDGERRW